MSTKLFESVARIARHEAQRRVIAGIGRVLESFPASPGAVPPDHAVTLEMRDTGLVLPRVPVAVGVMGFAAIPAVDDLVVVVFMDGDVNAGVVVGRLYHSDLTPPEHEDGLIKLSLPAGESQPKVDLKVDGAAGTIDLVLPRDVHIALAEESVEIIVGEIKIVVQGAGGGRAEVAAGGSRLLIKQDGDISLETQGKLTLSGSEVEIAGDTSVTINGAKVDIN